MRSVDPRRLRATESRSLGDRLAGSALGIWWSGLQDRERRLVSLALLVMGLAFLWLVALQPAIQLLRQAPGRLDALDAQTQAMQRLAAETRELRSAPQVNTAQSVAALRSATERLGHRAKVVVQGDRATVTLDNLDGETMRAWLSELRSGARTRPVEAQLSRGPKGYSGTLTLAIGGTP